MSDNQLDVHALQYRLKRLRKKGNALRDLHENIESEIKWIEIIIDDFILSPEEKEERRKKSMIPNEAREAFKKDYEEALNLSRWLREDGRMPPFSEVGKEES